MLLELYYYIASKPCPYSDDRRCNTSQACIRHDRWCNQQIDCMDGSDEECCKSTIINISTTWCKILTRKNIDKIDEILEISQLNISTM